VIVADTNTIAYLLIPGEATRQVQAVLKTDPVWIAPALWRSEFLNVLALYMRKKDLSLDRAVRLMEEADLLMRGRSYAVSSSEVLALAMQSKCAAYDCEFVALARDMGIPLVTSDIGILKAFPRIAISPGAFVNL
jgi:predicted nucleic acid-binding protein